MSLEEKIRKEVLLPDIHYPYHHKPSFNAVLNFLTWFKPHRVVLLGDALEMRAINHWKKERKNMKFFEGKRLLKDYKNFIRDILRPIEKAIPEGCEKVYMGGNHEEWAYLLITKNPQLEGLIEPEKAMNLKRRKWKWIPYKHKDEQGNVYRGKLKTGKLTVFHGAYLNKYHAARTSDVFSKSVAYAHCFDEETELLTKRGFLKVDDIKEGDVCLTLNKDTGLLEWDEVKKKFVFEHNGRMIEFKSPLINLLVDENHGMVWRNCSNGKRKYGKAKELIGKKGAIIFDVAGLKVQKKDYPISNDLLKLLAWIISEGSIRYINNTPYVDIVQSEEKRIVEIKELLDNLGFTYLLKKKIKSKISVLQPYRFRIHVKGSKIITSFLPDKNTVPGWLWNLSNRQFLMFFEEYIKGDGTTYSGKYVNQKILYSNNKEWIDFFQAMLFMNGYKSTPYWRKGSLGKKLCCQLNCQNKKIHELKSKNNLRMIFYKGIKWCVNTNNGTLVIRRNGLMTITQNSHDVQLYTKVHEEDPEDYHTAQSIGCLCNRAPEYKSGRPNRWVHGFGVVYVRENGFYNLYVPIIINGSFVFAGKLFKGDE